VLTFCTVQGSGLAAWCALESARLVNPPELMQQVEREFADGWAGWETDEEADAVRAAFESARMWCPGAEPGAAPDPARR
jgi:hypothetical protein